MNIVDGRNIRDLMLVCWALLGAGAVQAQTGSSPVALDKQFETLRPDSSFREWRRAYREPEVFAESGNTYAAEADPVRNREVTAGFYKPLSESLSSLFEASYLPRNTGIPEWSVLGQVGAMLGSGWGLQAGLRHSEQGLLGLEGRGPEAQLGMLTLEKVWGSYRSRYTVYTSRKGDGTTTSGHRVALNYIYGGNSSVGLAYDRAWNVQNPLFLPIGGRAASSNVGVTGEHWLNRAWSVNYDALFQQGAATQGLKPELRAGLKLAF
ncbi:MAG: hypothetical protein EXR36_10470 [Betaproteobacteria bacterium]|nr:hypothetical protein [Betaproteobacteria bacterium]